MCVTRRAAFAAGCPRRLARGEASRSPYSALLPHVLESFQPRSLLSKAAFQLLRRLHAHRGHPRAISRGVRAIQSGWGLAGSPGPGRRRPGGGKAAGKAPGLAAALLFVKVSGQLGERGAAFFVVSCSLAATLLPWSAGFNSPSRGHGRSESSWAFDGPFAAPPGARQHGT